MREKLNCLRQLRYIFLDVKHTTLFNFLPLQSGILQLGLFVDTLQQPYSKVLCVAAILIVSVILSLVVYACYNKNLV